MPAPPPVDDERPYLCGCSKTFESWREWKLHNAISTGTGAHVLKRSPRREAPAAYVDPGVRYPIDEDTARKAAGDAIT